MVKKHNKSAQVMWSTQTIFETFQSQLQEICSAPLVLSYAIAHRKIQACRTQRVHSLMSCTSVKHQVFRLNSYGEAVANVIRWPLHYSEPQGETSSKNARGFPRKNKSDISYLKPVGPSIFPSTQKLSWQTFSVG